MDVREHYEEILSVHRQDEMDRIKNSFYRMLKGRGFSDQRIATEWRYCYALTLFNIPLDTVWRVIEEGIDDRGVALLDPVTRTRDPDGPSKWSEVIEWYVSEIDGQVMQTGDSLLLFGDNASGKTYAACHMMMAIVAKTSNTTRMTTYYLTSRNLYDVMHKSRYGTAREAQWAQAILGCDFLVIDELGKEEINEGKFNVLFEEHVKYRSVMALPTVIITNINVTGGSKKIGDGRVNTIKQKYGAGVWSVLQGKYHMISFDPRAQFRTKNRPQWGR